MSTPLNAELRHFLPDSIIELIRAQFALGVSQSEKHFKMHSSDEDSLTGGLGEAMANNGEFHASYDDINYDVVMTYEKIRGRGKGAPEKIFGTDGIFQLEVKDSNGNVIFSKGLPFQAKVEWRGTDKQLNEQAKKMENILGGGIVIDYSPNGYKAFNSGNVVNASGNRSFIDDNVVDTLENALCHNFLDCRIGHRNLYFDKRAESYVSALFSYEKELHVISTVVSVSD